jgi:hypothetical protein
MLTPETIRRHFTGPRRKGDDFTWRWYQRGRRWPRTSFARIYNPHLRKFHLERFKKVSQRAVAIREDITLDKITVDGFRACLSPEDIARCTAASIVAQPAVSNEMTFEQTVQTYGHVVGVRLK